MLSLIHFGHESNCPFGKLKFITQGIASFPGMFFHFKYIILGNIIVWHNLTHRKVCECLKYSRHQVGVKHKIGFLFI